MKKSERKIINQRYKEAPATFIQFRERDKSVHPLGEINMALILEGSSETIAHFLVNLKFDLYKAFVYIDSSIKKKSIPNYLLARATKLTMVIYTYHGNKCICKPAAAGAVIDIEYRIQGFGIVLFRQAAKKCYYFLVARPLRPYPPPPP